MLWYAMVCYGMLWYAMVCYGMLCYAILCYAMLCYAMLCYATVHWPGNQGKVKEFEKNNNFKESQGI